MKPPVKYWPLLLLLGLVRTSESLRWGYGGQWIAQDGDVNFTLRYDVTPDVGEEITFVTWYKVKDERMRVFVAASSKGTFSANSDYEGRVSLGGNHGNIVLHNVTLEDSGEFQCAVGRKGLEDQGPSLQSRVLHVRGSPEQPTIRQIGRAVENTLLNLSCTTTSTSLPPDPHVTFTYKWFVNDTLMEGQSDDRLTFNASRSHSGNYSCLAVENAERGMTSSRSDDLYVDVLFLPEITVVQSDPAPPFEVVAGHPMTLTCNVITANPPVPEDGYTWSYLPSPEALPVTQSARGRRLSVDHVTRESAGWYRCQASNEAGRSSSPPLHLTVLYTPVLHMEPRPITRHALQILEGDFLTLTCNVTEADPAVPVDGFSWSYLPSDDDVEMLLSGNESKVIVGPMTRGLSGTYSCSARNDFHTHSFISPASTSVHVSVVFSPTVRIESEGFRQAPYRVASGHSLNLTCRVLAANPPVPINGYRWSRLLPSGQEVELPGAGAVLDLGHVTRRTSGLYRCQARNDADLDLDIPLGSDSVLVDVMYLEHVNVSGDVEAVEGDVIALHCHVTSHPTARMTWSLDGRPSRHVTSNSDSYVIAGAACSDNGEYVCDVINEEIPGGFLSATTTVRVHCPPEEAGSKANESTVLASVGETARLSVAVVAFPPPTFKWYSPTHTGPLKDHIEANHSFAALTLRNLKVTDSGTYTVNVTNIHGTLTRHFLLLVDGGSTGSPLKRQEEADSPNTWVLTVLLVLTVMGWVVTVIGFAVYLRLRRNRSQWKRQPSTQASDGGQLDLVTDTPSPSPSFRQGRLTLIQEDGTLDSQKSSESDYGSGESQSFI